MQLLKKAMPVDAGLMALVSEDVLKEYGKRNGLKLMQYYGKGEDIPRVPWQFIRLKKAATVKLSIESYDYEEKTKKLKAGKYYIGDPCYVIKDWDRFLKDTDYCNSDLDNCIFLGNFGGDGEHLVEVNVL